MVLHGEVFAENAQDEDFIPEVGKHEEWIMLTHDRHQRYNAIQRDAVMRSGLAHFTLIGRMGKAEIEDSLLLLAPKIIRFRERHAPPFMAKMYRAVQKTPYRREAGAIELSLTYNDWRNKYGR